MKVGVYIGDSAPQLGGGFTFEEEICTSLVRLAGESQHRFVLITAAAPEQLRSMSGAMEVISIRRSLSHRISKRLAVEGQKITNRVREVAARRPIVTDTERQLCEHGIELVWSLNFNTPVLNIPFVTTVWDLQHRLQPFFPEVSTDGHWEAREKLFGKTLRRAAGVIAGTEVGSLEIQRFYGVAAERIWILPHPTPRFALEAPAPIGRETIAKFGLPDSYIFYPAQFWPHKNHVGILRALKVLRDEQGVQIAAAFVGSDRGNLQHVKQVASELQLTDQVFFLGFVSREELVGLYRNALGLVYPTFFGPENLPPLEAFALGCPVIASNVPGSEEQLADAALRVDAADHRAIALAIMRLVTEPQLRSQLVERGRIRAQCFTGSDFVRKALAHIDAFEPYRMCWGPGVYQHR